MMQKPRVQERKLQKSIQKRIKTVMVLDTRGETYRPYLESELTKDLKFYYETNPETQVTCDALLARPDFAAQYLQRISSPPVWIQSTWAGVETLIAPLRKYPDTLLTGLKGIFGPPIAEYTFNYLLESVRRSELFKANQEINFWPKDYQSSDTLQDKVLCIIGCGSIGCHVAKVAQVFGMEVIGVSRRVPTLDQLKHTELKYFNEISQDMKYAVSNADYILACLPDTDATKNIIDKSIFSAMKASAIIINIGRGATLHLDDLLTALRTRSIKSAILDVLPEEPLSPDNPLWHEQNLIITPHIAATSTPRNIANLFLENLT